jgi:adenylate cyclase
MGVQTTVQTTVVFADLIGSTGIFEATGNAKATLAVTQLTRWICEVFVSHGGHVVKTLGDGVLATFPNGSSAVDACVEMQRSHQKRIANTHTSMRMPIRIGVASGEVEIVSGDCYGDAVNVAARLSDLSGAHQIWASNTALAHIPEPDNVRFRPLGPINIRGRAEPCSVFQVEWSAEESSEFLTMQADLSPILAAPQVDALGRQIELTWLSTHKSFKSFELPVHIGRVRHVEFVVNDPRVSREHARIEWRNGSVMLTDISTYGSWVRFSGAGSDLLLRREECVLHGRGEIALGASFADLSVPTVAFAVS